MSLDIFHEDRYKLLMQEHLGETIAFLLDQGEEFAVACDMRHVTFDPELPRELRGEMDDVSLFVIGGYTFETARVFEDELIFEAGFGEEAFGSLLSIPLLAIKQILVDQYPIAINITEPMRKKSTQATERSMSALLNNPENQRLLKKT